VSDYSTLLRALVMRRSLEPSEMAASIGAIMDGDWSTSQAAAFLAALAVKGETAQEVYGAAEAMRARSVRVEHELPLVVDTCGTGGDGAHTINISTAVGFVVAGAGLPVAKHGNRAASSLCGSADVLEASGITIDASPEVAREHLEIKRFAFLFAQAYHPAMKVVGPVRRELGIRTIFNVLGPLANPARATHQIIGVSNPATLELVGEALIRLGVRGGAVVHALNGIDEIAGDAPSEVFEFSAQGPRRYRIDPSDYGIHAPLETLAGGDPSANAAALAAILQGERSPRAEVVALNAALAFVIAERAEGLREGLALARESLRGGSALAVFQSLRRSTEVQFV
jgi:anthranilate phosphoribosyltransferase